MLFFYGNLPAVIVIVRAVPMLVFFLLGYSYAFLHIGSSFKSSEYQLVPQKSTHFWKKKKKKKKNHVSQKKKNKKQNKHTTNPQTNKQRERETIKKKKQQDSHI
eukprot:TRINITY_DN44298_c0_g1_i1.p2 TRINITY_DN44298_c0_g1~~TRINITY_DN44298_c0_g1_i1.p2  ORF type:complete len:104 (+),score=18.87 TRINITY_DN44298_c0_g1_i1:226-537(+)